MSSIQYSIKTTTNIINSTNFDGHYIPKGTSNDFFKSNRETVNKVAEAFSSFISSEIEESQEVTTHLKWGESMELFPLKIKGSFRDGFSFRIPLKSGLINKAFIFSTYYFKGVHSGFLADLYPVQGLTEDYKLTGRDLMNLIDVIAEVFKLSEVSLTDKSHCMTTGKEPEQDEIEQELVRFGNLHNLSLEKSGKRNYSERLLQQYNISLQLSGGFALRYSRAMIKGNSWYGQFGYYPESMSPEEYLDFIAKVRDTDLRRCFSETESKNVSFAKLMYREFASETGKGGEHTLGNFFTWLSAERPNAIYQVIGDINRGCVCQELNSKFYEIDYISRKMIKKFNY